MLGVLSLHAADLGVFPAQPDGLVVVVADVAPLCPCGLKVLFVCVLLAGGLALAEGSLAPLASVRHVGVGVGRGRGRASVA